MCTMHSIYCIGYNKVKRVRELTVIIVHPFSMVACPRPLYISPRAIAADVITPTTHTNNTVNFLNLMTGKTVSQFRWDVVSQFNTNTQKNTRFISGSNLTD